jgi:hypothetical protein
MPLHPVERTRAGRALVSPFSCLSCSLNVSLAVIETIRPPCSDQKYYVLNQTLLCERNRVPIQKGADEAAKQATDHSHAHARMFQIHIHCEMLIPRGVLVK